MAITATGFSNWINASAFGLNDVTDIVPSATSVVITTYTGYTITLTGKFANTSGGNPEDITGTITQIAWTNDSDDENTISGLNVNAAQFVSLIVANEGLIDTDIELFEDRLNSLVYKGNDHVIGHTEDYNQIFGGAGNNKLVGGDVGNDFLAFDGNNTITGGADSDYVVVGNGKNTISTGDGEDTIYAGNGANSINAGDGDNYVEVGNGNNKIITGDGYDQVYAGSGNNIVQLGEGYNLFYANLTESSTSEIGDPVTTTEGGVTTTTQTDSYSYNYAYASGNNTITGGDGEDYIFVGGGNNTIDAGNGSNYVWMTENASFGEDYQTVTTADSSDGSTTTEYLRQQTYSLQYGDGNNRIVGGDDYDHVRVGGGNNVIGLGDGSNYLYVTEQFTREYDYQTVTTTVGEDSSTATENTYSYTFAYGDGNNKITGGDDYDHIQVGGGNNVANLGDGYNYFQAAETRSSSWGDQGLNGQTTSQFWSYSTHYGDGSNKVTGGDGEDHITVGDGNNSVVLGDASYTITIGEDSQSISSYNTFYALESHSSNWEREWTGSNTYNETYSYEIVYGGGNNKVVGGDDDDYVYVGSGNNNISLGDGNNRVHVQDTVNYEAHNSYDGSYWHQNDYSYAITYGDGNNRITAGDGNDYVAVGSGNNSISLGDGDNLAYAMNTYNRDLVGGEDSYQIDFGDGNNKITGGAGEDFVLVGSGDNSINLGQGDNLVYTIDNLSVATDNSFSALFGGGNNKITVGNGDDTVIVGNGDNVVRLGEGDNVLYSATSASGYLSGEDTLEPGFLFSTDIANFDFSDGGNNNIVAGSGDDFVVVGTGNNSISLGNGANIVYALESKTYDTDGDFTRDVFGDGNNKITLGNGDDEVYVGGGNNVIKLGDGYNLVYSANSAMYSDASEDYYYGYDFSDGGNNTITGGKNIDEVYVGSGDDTIQLGKGADGVDAGAGSNKIDLGKSDGDTDWVDFNYNDFLTTAAEGGTAFNKVTSFGAEDQLWFELDIDTSEVLIQNGKIDLTNASNDGYVLALDTSSGKLYYDADGSGSEYNFEQIGLIQGAGVKGLTSANVFDDGDWIAIGNVLPV